MRIRHFYLIIIAILLISVSTFTAQPNKAHLVKRGDTLWDISAFYLNNPFLWPSIYQANKVKIENPHWIYPGQNFLIPPLLMGKREVYIRPKYGKKTPTVSKVEAIKIATPMVATNLSFKGGFISNTKIEKGYIVESEPKNKENIVSSNTVYIDLGENDGINVGDLYTIFRWGKVVKDPVTGKDLGKIVNVLGKLVVKRVAENSSAAEIVQSFDIIKNHDLIFPYTSQSIPISTKLEIPENPIEGNLAAVKKESDTIKPFDIVYINLGESNNVCVGDYFEIIRKGKVVSDPGPKKKVKLPEIVAGGLQVLSSTTETATCYITEINGNMDIKTGETIRLKGKGPAIKGKPETEEETEEELEVIEEEEEIIGPE